ncbi:type I-G CRISPR-associated protein Csb2 [Niveispirillum irakense]|uniref:type I-G CRISPR-associated protein Csb2 n=1 Tax=Niveispirillum irakense TaxID=34011 RepID=UPI00041C8297|nr:type I-U CRISPR-associated protein Csb2 [Niveispirillum irakense]
MPTRALLIEVTLLDARYHGVGDWPPAPWRLFQALVAGAYGGQWAAEEAADKDTAFTWMERLSPPHIATPSGHLGSEVLHYVPNNGLDAKGGDPARVAEMRVPKRVRPRLLDSQTLLYAWPFDQGEEQAARIAALASRLHTLGRGIDPAFAKAEVLDWEAAAERLRQHGGAIARPMAGGGGANDPGCPTQGSLASLKARFEAARRQYQPGKEGRTLTLNFARPPKPLFRPVAYDRPPARLLCELRRSDGRFAAQPMHKAVDLTTRIRDRAAALLKTRLPDRADMIDLVLVGLDAGPADKDRRVRLIPLPSIGMAHTDAAIRRLLVEVPPDCPLPRDEVLAVFSGLDMAMDPETGEIVAEGEDLTLVPTGTADGMAGHYGLLPPDRGGDGHHKDQRDWISITPLSLPAPRRRMDAGRLRHPDEAVRLAEAKNGTERLAEEAQARSAVLDACRHAGIDPRLVLAIRVQREPFLAKGEAAERFANPPRFSRHSLWHVALTFAKPMSGPLLLGNGRWLGLGLMAPSPAVTPSADADAVSYTLSPDCRPPVAQRAAATQAVRAALMSLARDGRGGVPTLFSGHEDGPEAARSGAHRHIYIALLDTDGDGLLDQVQVIAPWRVDRTVTDMTGAERQSFTRVTGQLALVRAGAVGLLSLSSAQPLPLATGTVWTSQTRYRPTRHPGRDTDPALFIAADIQAELSRRGLPAPVDIQVTDILSGPRDGLSARLTLRFAKPVTGPILLGRDAHRGGGMMGLG